MRGPRQVPALQNQPDGEDNTEEEEVATWHTDADAVKVDGCGVFEGMLTSAEDVPGPRESWIDTQVEESDKANEF